MRRPLAIKFLPVKFAVELPLLSRWLLSDFLLIGNLLCSISRNLEFTSSMLFEHENICKKEFEWRKCVKS
jgi:hypothetical protein